MSFPRNEGLSAREMQCLQLVANGYQDAEGASQMNITARTFRFHVNNVKRKLKAKTKAHAIALAFLTYALHIHPPAPKEQVS